MEQLTLFKETVTSVNWKLERTQLNICPPVGFHACVQSPERCLVVRSRTKPRLSRWIPVILSQQQNPIYQAEQRPRGI